LKIGDGLGREKRAKEDAISILRGRAGLRARVKRGRRNFSGTLARGVFWVSAARDKPRCRDAN